MSYFNRAQLKTDTAEKRELILRHLAEEILPAAVEGPVICYDREALGQPADPQVAKVGVSSAADFKGNIVRGGINYKF